MARRTFRKSLVSGLTTSLRPGILIYMQNTDTTNQEDLKNQYDVPAAAARVAMRGVQDAMSAHFSYDMVLTDEKVAEITAAAALLQEALAALKGEG